MPDLIPGSLNLELLHESQAGKADAVNRNFEKLQAAFNGFVGSNAYDLGANVAYHPDDDMLVAGWVMTRAISLPALLAGSVAAALTPPAGAVSYAIHHVIGNADSTIGSIDFAAAATFATFTFASQVDFAAGEVCYVRAPSSAGNDATIADLLIGLKALDI